jgi:hypothetical protein
MFAYSVWINKMFDTLRLGCVVGVREALDDYDYETDQYVSIYTNDRQFRMAGGKVYCKGGSVMYPRPATDADGWEIEPIEDPYNFFHDVLDNGCVNDVYISQVSTPIWNVQTGWVERKEIIKHAVSPAFLKTAEVEEGVSSSGFGVSQLKVMAGLATLDLIGPLSLKEISYCFDHETFECLLKPVVMWVPV